MDALRLVRSTRHSLAEARSAADVLVESWQACTLTEAVAAHLALYGEESGRAVAQLLAEAGGHAGGCLEQPADAWTGFDRAARLSAVGDAGVVLRELRGLIHEAAEALTVLACGAEDEALYWQCIDAVDAAAECKDGIGELLLALREEAAPEQAELPGPGEEQGPPPLVAVAPPHDVEPRPG